MHQVEPITTPLSAEDRNRASLYKPTTTGTSVIYTQTLVPDADSQGNPVWFAYFTQNMSEACASSTAGVWSFVNRSQVISSRMRACNPAGLPAVYEVTVRVG
jgi:hypothetical protein